MFSLKKNINLCLNVYNFFHKNQYEKIIFTKNKNLQTNINGILVYIITYLFYESCMMYVSLLNDNYNIYYYIISFFKSIYLICIFHNIDNDISFIEKLNNMFFINTLSLIFQYLFLFINDNYYGVKNNDVGFLYLCIFLNNFYYFTILGFFIKTFNDYKFKFIEKNNENIIECCICLERIDFDHFQLNCCKNYVHKLCINQYIEYNKNSICIYCRENFENYGEIYL